MIAGVMVTDGETSQLWDYLAIPIRKVANKQEISSSINPR